METCVLLIGFILISLAILSVLVSILVSKIEDLRLETRKLSIELKALKES